MPGLDERRHQRQLGREPALLRLAGHPRRDLLARRVVAGVGVGRRGGDRRRGGRGRPRRARRAAPRRRWPSAARRPSGTPASRRAPPAARRAAPCAVTAFRNTCESLATPGAAAAAGGDRRPARARRAPGAAGAAAGAAGRRRGAAAAARRLPARRRRRSAATSAGGFQSRRDRLLEADVEVVLVGGVGEVAGAGDRERGADLVGADGRGPASRARRRPRGRAGCRGRRSRRRSRRCPCRGRSVVGDRAAGGELGWSEHMQRR